MKSKVFQTALKNDVLYVPGELCYADDPSRAKPDNEMRISFGSASEENIREGNHAAGQGVARISVITPAAISCTGHPKCECGGAARSRHRPRHC